MNDAISKNFISSPFSADMYLHLMLLARFAFGRLLPVGDRPDPPQSGRPHALCVLLDDLADTKKIAVQIDDGKFFEAPRFVF